jgi:hypothetical protein
MEQEASPSLGERQVSKLIDDQKINAVEFITNLASLPIPMFGFQLIHKVNSTEEANAAPIADGLGANSRDEMRFTGSSAPDEHSIPGLLDEVAIVKRADGP